MRSLPGGFFTVGALASNSPRFSATWRSQVGAFVGGALSGVWRSLGDNPSQPRQNEQKPGTERHEMTGKPCPQ